MEVKPREPRWEYKGPPEALSKAWALLEKNVIEAGHRMVERRNVQDDKVEIQNLLKLWIEANSKE